jgi:hypothetical protein
MFVKNIISYFQPGDIGGFLRTNLGMKYICDNSKLKKDLISDFIDLETTINDNVQYFIDFKLVDDPKNLK